MNHVIVMTMYKRLRYTRTVLDALSRCEGVDKYRIFLHCEPGCRAVEDLARAFPLPGKEVVINPRKLGCTRNTFAALDHGFGASDYVIALEDDVVPALDALRFFEHCREAYRDDLSVFTACAYGRHPAGPEDFYKLTRTQWFTPWGWATWIDRWKPGRGLWQPDSPTSWDVIFNQQIRGDRYEVSPLLARTQNIGAVDGTYCTDPKWHRENQFNEHWAGAVALPGGQFVEVR